SPLHNRCITIRGRRLVGSPNRQRTSRSSPREVALARDLVPIFQTPRLLPIPAQVAAEHTGPSRAIGRPGGRGGRRGEVDRAGLRLRSLLKILKPVVKGTVGLVEILVHGCSPRGGQLLAASVKKGLAMVIRRKRRNLTEDFGGSGLGK